MKNLTHILSILGTWMAAALSLMASSATATSVAPAGANFTAVASGITLTTTFEKGQILIPTRCLSSSFTGTIPTAPDNPVDLGSVTIPISAPSFTGCDIAGLVTKVITHTTFGNWTLTFNFLGGKALGTITIPDSGIQISPEPLSCIMHTPTAQYAPVTGLWTGTSGSLALNEQQMSLTATGTCFEPGPTINLTGTYALKTSTGVTVKVTA